MRGYIFLYGMMMFKGLVWSVRGGVGLATCKVRKLVRYVDCERKKCVGNSRLI